MRPISINARSIFLAAIVPIAILALVAGSLAGRPEQETSRETQGIRVPRRVPIHSYEVVKVYPHDRGAFTQGLVYHNGFLYESTGLNGESSFRKVDLAYGTGSSERGPCYCQSIFC